MNCVRIRNLLSEYLDGEIQRTDREIVEEHLAQCDSCAHVSAVMQSTSMLLSEVGEVEPPAGLLAQIEAATINRPTLGQRVRAMLAHLTSVPASARWAMASATAVIALVFVMMSHPGVHRIANAPVPQSPSSVTAAQPATPSVITPAPKLGPVVVVETNPVLVWRAAHRYRRHTTRVARSSAPYQAPAKPMPSVTEIPSTDVDTTKVAESIPTDTSDGNVVQAAAPGSDTDKEIKISKASVAPQPDWQKKEADSLAALRTKLAARSKQRRYEVQPETLDGRKVSIDLASIRF